VLASAEAPRWERVRPDEATECCSEDSYEIHRETPTDIKTEAAFLRGFASAEAPRRERPRPKEASECGTEDSYEIHRETPTDITTEVSKASMVDTGAFITSMAEQAAANSEANTAFSSSRECIAEASPAAAAASAEPADGAASATTSAGECGTGGACTPEASKMRTSEGSSDREPEVAGEEDHNEGDVVTSLRFAVGQRVACRSDRYGWVMGTVLKTNVDGAHSGYLIVLDDNLGNIDVNCDTEEQIRDELPVLILRGIELNGDFLTGLALGTTGSLFLTGWPAVFALRHVLGDAVVGKVALAGLLSHHVLVATLGYKNRGDVGASVGQFLRLLHVWSMPVWVTLESMGLCLPILSVLQRLEFAVFLKSRCYRGRISQ